ncbi:Apoptosis inhibitor 1 [Frankliniella fusca]|uniref:Apoptosis inhibitor 1 n=1 Tax=Frankliniella fusca TaxID=407009 RepID=A0AAE1HJ99_9NEOP|nr:Apoptosis inhibitor 1 [Frankliniella fusca]
MERQRKYFLVEKSVVVEYDSISNPGRPPVYSYQREANFDYSVKPAEAATERRYDMEHIEDRRQYRGGSPGWEFSGASSYSDHRRTDYVHSHFVTASAPSEDRIRYAVQMSKERQHQKFRGQSPEREIIGSCSYSSEANRAVNVPPRAESAVRPYEGGYPAPKIPGERPIRGRSPESDYSGPSAYSSEQKRAENVLPRSESAVRPVDDSYPVPKIPGERHSRGRSPESNYSGPSAFSSEQKRVDNVLPRAESAVRPLEDTYPVLKISEERPYRRLSPESNYSGPSAFSSEPKRVDNVLPRSESAVRPIDGSYPVPKIPGERHHRGCSPGSEYGAPLAYSSDLIRADHILPRSESASRPFEGSNPLPKIPGERHSRGHSPGSGYGGPLAYSSEPKRADNVLPRSESALRPTKGSYPMPKIPGERHSRGYSPGSEYGARSASDPNRANHILPRSESAVRPIEGSYSVVPKIPGERHSRGHSRGSEYGSPSAYSFEQKRAYDVLPLSKSAVRPGSYSVSKIPGERPFRDRSPESDYSGPPAYSSELKRADNVLPRSESAVRPIDGSNPVPKIPGERQYRGRSPGSKHVGLSAYSSEPKRSLPRSESAVRRFDGGYPVPKIPGERHYRGRSPESEFTSDYRKDDDYDLPLSGMRNRIYEETPVQKEVGRSHHEVLRTSERLQQRRLRAQPDSENSDIDDPPPPAKTNKKEPANDNKTLSEIAELLANPGPSKKAPAKKKRAKKTGRSKKKTVESEEEDEEEGKGSSVEENQMAGPKFSDEIISISSDSSDKGWDSDSMVGFFFMDWIFQDMDGSLSPFRGDHEGKDPVTDYDCTYCLEKWKPGEHKGSLIPCQHDSFCYHCAYGLFINAKPCPLCRRDISAVQSIMV